MNLEEILKESEECAEQIIGNTEAIRNELRAARPNSSEESTTRGVLEALSIIMPAIPR